MQSTNVRLEKGAATEEHDDCDYDWCDGPGSDTLPCFACFDPTRDYGQGDDSA